jgi:hypothetical protein
MSFSARATFLPLMIAAVAIAEEKPAGLPKTSPFMPVGTPVAAVDGAAERIEFAGVSSIGKKTDLIFYDKVAKKNYWIAKGETKEGISVVNYDERREQAFVKINGTDKILTLRKGTTSAGGPRAVAVMPPAAGFAMPTPGSDPGQKTQAASPLDPASVPAPQSIVSAHDQPGTPPQPTTPEAQAQQKAETEARMLVSDLLEIGMAQRKAYEEAQRKAAEGNRQNPTAPDASKP